MTENLKQQLNKEIIKLPKEKQDAINSIDWVGEVEKIGKKFILTDESILDLQMETFVVLLGYIDFDLYVLNIENEIGLNKESSQIIADEILVKVFTPIAEKIESSIKNSINSKNIPWDQTIDFILLGGDYSVFVK